MKRMKRSIDFLKSKKAGHKITSTLIKLKKNYCKNIRKGEIGIVLDSTELQVTIQIYPRGDILLLYTNEVLPILIDRLSDRKRRWVIVNLLS